MAQKKKAKTGSSFVGEIFRLGPHRLMCGDSTNPAHVAKLFDGVKPHLVFTSPPYAQQREYRGPIGDWDALMQGVFGSMPHTEDTQVLVNLGLVHTDGEWIPYWDKWIGWMRSKGWRRFGWYVWDKKGAVSGDWHGRLAPRHEWVFHFNRKARQPNKTIRCKTAGKIAGGTKARNKDGSLTPKGNAGQPIAQFKIPESVVSVWSGGNATGHPAVFPIELPCAFIDAYTHAGEVVYEPFSGSGTTIMAAQASGRICYGMEIAPHYVEATLKRWADRYAGVGAA